MGNGVGIHNRDASSEQVVEHDGTLEVFMDDGKLGRDWTAHGYGGAEDFSNRFRSRSASCASSFGGYMSAARRR